MGQLCSVVHLNKTQRPAVKEVVKIRVALTLISQQVKSSCKVKVKKSLSKITSPHHNDEKENGYNCAQLQYLIIIHREDQQREEVLQS